MQVTYVEPYFDDWEDKERSTVYDRFFNIRKILVDIQPQSMTTHTDRHALILYLQVVLRSTLLSLLMAKHMETLQTST